jgi:hypothetical protein
MNGEWKGSGCYLPPPPPLGSTALHEPWPPVLFVSTRLYPGLFLSILQSPSLVDLLEHNLKRLRSSRDIFPKRLYEGRRCHALGFNQEPADCMSISLPVHQLAWFYFVTQKTGNTFFQRMNLQLTLKSCLSVDKQCSRTLLTLFLICVEHSMSIRSLHPSSPCPRSTNIYI